MFPLLRVLFILIVVLWAYCLWKQHRTGDLFWQRARGWLRNITVALLVVMVLGLFVERLLV
ncbi:DUF3810 domain-containing protein [Chitinimonas arctica]|uniref:DUF3810 domain-containing protein n=1 Tax=Chitinimonas arctica TaxID=2594795 RepID=A0A516SF00_9NEIS|nr:DUF3810 domain-containing protein [Chitinimonas arctica]QDQ26731.1 DUF3810 domain-containing protein [Chitinimonas arctica]